jgi:hypothetical protein
MESRISLVMIVQNMSLDALKFSLAFLIEFGEIKRRQKNKPTAYKERKHKSQISVVENSKFYKSGDHNCVPVVKLSGAV